MKKIMALVLAILMVASVMTTVALAEDVPVIYYVGPVGGTGFPELQQGFEDAIRELGWEGYYVGPGLSNYSMESCLEFTQTAITAQADGILGYFTDYSYVRDLLTEEKQKGTLIGLVGGAYAEGDEAMTDFMLSVSSKDLALLQAKSLEEMADGAPVKVVFMQSYFTNSVQNAIYEALKEYFADSPNIILDSQQEVKVDATTASELISNLRKADPEINAVIMCDGTATAGVANYIDENNLQDEMYLVAIDYSQELFQFIKDGTVDCTVCQDFYAQGYNGPYLFKDILDGKEVAMEQFADVYRVDASNVEEYAESFGFTLK